MREQFKPSVTSPLTLAEVKEMLLESGEQWPHPCALCVMASEEGRAEDAKQYFELFQRAIADKPSSWADERKHGLIESISAIGSESLREGLARLRKDQMKALRLSDG